jgi:hypothetical protein
MTRVGPGGARALLKIGEDLSWMQREILEFGPVAAQKPPKKAKNNEHQDAKSNLSMKPHPFIAQVDRDECSQDQERQSDVKETSWKIPNFDGLRHIFNLIR